MWPEVTSHNSKLANTQCFFWKQKGGSTSAKDVSIEAPRGWGVERGSPLSVGEESGEGNCAPSPEIFFIFEAQNR